MPSGNFIVDFHESDSRWHNLDSKCYFCEDTSEVRSIREWICAAREAHWLEYKGNTWRKALVECHKILINGKVECPCCA